MDRLKPKANFISFDDVLFEIDLVPGAVLEWRGQKVVCAYDEENTYFNRDRCSTRLLGEGKTILLLEVPYRRKHTWPDDYKTYEYVLLRYLDLHTGLLGTFIYNAASGEPWTYLGSIDVERMI